MLHAGLNGPVMAFSVQLAAATRNADVDRRRQPRLGNRSTCRNRWAMNWPTGALVADYRLHGLAPSNEICTTGSARDRAARLSAKAAASAAPTASARLDAVTVRLMSARLGGSSCVRHVAE